MLAGLNDTGQSMFPRLMSDIKPSPEDMEKEAQKALYNKNVKFKQYYVKTFNLGHPQEAVKYAKLVSELFVGSQALTHVIFFNNRQFTTAGDNPRWIAHIEWAELELKVRATPIIGTKVKRMHK